MSSRNYTRNESIRGVKSTFSTNALNQTKYILRFSSHGPSGYSNGPPPDFSFSGPDPYGAYSNIHPDISPIEHLHHHASGFGDSHPDISSFDHDHHHDHHEHEHEHDSIPDSFVEGSEPGGQTAQAGSPSAEQSKMTRRVYNQMRQLGNPLFDR